MHSQYAVTTDTFSGLKSRPGNYPYAPVVEESGVPVIVDRKFSNNKDTGRNASELRGNRFIGLLYESCISPATD